jgi:hypothetical protein
MSGFQGIETRLFLAKGFSELSINIEKLECI